MIAFRTSIEIERPSAEVYAVVGDPMTYPGWNSAVRWVKQMDYDVYWAQRDLPSGSTASRVEVIAARASDLVVIAVSGRAAPFVYRYGFQEVGWATELTLYAEVELGAAEDILGPLTIAAIRRDVDDDLAALKRFLEGGRSYESFFQKYVVSQ